MFMEKLEQVYDMLGERSKHIMISTSRSSLDGRVGTWFRSILSQDKTTIDKVKPLSSKAFLRVSHEYHLGSQIFNGEWKEKS